MPQPSRLRAQIARDMDRASDQGAVDRLPEPAFVEVVDEGYGWFLYCFSRTGVALGAVWFMTREEATHQAELEFKVAENDWEVIGG